MSKPTIAEAVDALKAKYEAQETVDESAKTLLAGLAQQIRDNATVPEALLALADKIDADTAAMSDAIIANTPEAPTT